MKTYVYSYRQADGTLTQGEIQETDRCTAIRRIKEKGILPVSINEGKIPKPLTFLPSFSWHSPTLKLMMAGCVLLTGLMILRVAKSTSGDKTAPPSKPQIQRHETPPSNERQPQPQPSMQKTPDHALEADVPPDQSPIEQRLRAVRPTPVTQSPSRATTEKAPDNEPKRPAPFKTVTEQILAIATSMPPDVNIPPLPDIHGLDQDFSRASTNTLVILEDDGDELAGRIETVAWAKVELNELVKQGWKPDEILTELVRQHNENASFRSAASLALKKMLDNGELTAPALKTELQLLNEEMVGRGLSEITLAELGVTDQ